MVFPGHDVSLNFQGYRDCEESNSRQPVLVVQYNVLVGDILVVENIIHILYHSCPHLEYCLAGVH